VVSKRPARSAEWLEEAVQLHHQQDVPRQDEGLLPQGAPARDGESPGDENHEIYIYI